MLDNIRYLAHVAVHTVSLSLQEITISLLRLGIKRVHVGTRIQIHGRHILYLRYSSDLLCKANLSPNAVYSLSVLGPAGSARPVLPTGFCAQCSSYIYTGLNTSSAADPRRCLSER